MFYDVMKYISLQHKDLPTITLLSPGSSSSASRVHSRLAKEDDKATLNLRNKHIGAFIPEEVIAKTLKATTQLVPSLLSETRFIMHDHLKKRKT